MERIKVKGSKVPAELYKYSGVVTIVGDRLHMLDQETLTGSELTHTILYTGYRNRVTLQMGLTIGVSVNDAHFPSASRISMEYVGRHVNLRTAVADCGLFSLDDMSIPQTISRYLTQIGSNDNPGQIQANPL